MDQSDVKSNIIFIAGLMPSVTKEQVRTLFKRFGKILSVDLIRKRPQNVYAFIEFDDMRDAADVIWQAGLLELKGKRLRIEYRNGGLNEKKEDQGISSAKQQAQPTPNGLPEQTLRIEDEAKQAANPNLRQNPPLSDKIQNKLELLLSQNKPQQQTEARRNSSRSRSRDRPSSNSILSTVNDLKRIVKDLQSRVEQLQRERLVNRDGYVKR